MQALCPGFQNAELLIPGGIQKPGEIWRDPGFPQGGPHICFGKELGMGAAGGRGPGEERGLEDLCHAWHLPHQDPVAQFIGQDSEVLSCLASLGSVVWHH